MLKVHEFYEGEIFLYLAYEQKVSMYDDNFILFFKY